MPDDPLKKKADQPKSAEVDGQKVEQHSLRDQIEMDRYLASKKATRSGRGFRITKMKSGQHDKSLSCLIEKMGIKDDQQ